MQNNRTRAPVENGNSSDRTNKVRFEVGLTLDFDPLESLGGALLKQALVGRIGRGRVLARGSGLLMVATLAGARRGNRNFNAAAAAICNQCNMSR